MILLIDNYDSFSYNLYQLIGQIEKDIKVVRNDKVTISQIKEMKPDLIVLSPGPGKPENAGICPQVVRELGGEIPIFGVCLGHQVICQVYGANVTYAKKMMHGKVSEVIVDEDSRLFTGMKNPVRVARYHSLAAGADTIPEELKVTARTADGEVMAVEHRTFPVCGVQFHPESVLTPEGLQILQNMAYGIIDF
ncbi:anthranilate synthase component II [Hespellia stercorisuis]|uniref:Anthranilate synthase component 2 n=1 Tax=Hespellia stercorisuis DSM 15480 TaxID=1121950 RepID=A0A1M6RBR8_9FIRM|nr:aminodeoxychorismate/anthranilate synthase component II [Hespellia stercorisuis]SHK29850.1 anthranilate synthase component 2 [Hespellia stercorisuis DSM 15480]